MKKQLVILGAIAIMFFGSVGVSSAQTSINDSALLAQLFDMVKDLASAISSIIERQVVNITDNAGSSDVTGSKTPISVPTLQPASKLSPEPGVFSFKVNSPATGESWTIGKKYRVSWISDSPSAGAIEQPNFVSIYLVSTNNASKKPTVIWTVASFARNTGSYDWTVSNKVYPGEYMVAVEPYARPDRRSIGGTFSIMSDSAVPPTQGVLSNNTIGVGGALGYVLTSPSDRTSSVWSQGTTYTIRWQSTDPSVSLKETDYVSISVVSAKDTSKTVLSISRKAYNDGDFRWFVPKTISTGIYQIVVAPIANSSLKAISSEFSVVPTGNPVPRAGDTFINTNGQQTKIDEGGIGLDRLFVRCCGTSSGGNCYIESGGVCGPCFNWCSTNQ